jgi:hypothetical protein
LAVDWQPARSPEKPTLAPQTAATIINAFNGLTTRPADFCQVRQTVETGSKFDFA